RKISDPDWFIGSDGGFGEGARKSSAGGGQRLTTSQRHLDLLPEASCFICRGSAPAVLTPLTIALIGPVELDPVSRRQLEGAVLERIGFDHDDLRIRVAVMLLWREGDVAVHAGLVLQLVQIVDDLLRLGAGALH